MLGPAQLAVLSAAGAVVVAAPSAVVRRRAAGGSPGPALTWELLGAR
ncbi:MAG TPA: hypothetical protein VHF26_17125 [Trebonia sp.]|nr:hypothetical protein [Trebonia sp.]